MPEHSEADVEFMQTMTRHHARALEMTRLVPSPEDIERMDISQEDDRVHGAARPRGGAPPSRGAEHARHTDRGAARGTRGRARADFDRLFLERMHYHHMGALAMVAELFATEGAGEEPEIFQSASTSTPTSG